MSKMIRVVDEVYTLLKEKAEKDNRSIANTLDTLLRTSLGASSVPSEPKKPRPVPRVFQKPPTGGELIESVPIPTKRLTNGLCKIHNTPLTPYGKCLQKGCKYA